MRPEANGRFTLAENVELERYLDFQFSLIPPDAPANMVPLVELLWWLEGDESLAAAAFSALEGHGASEPVRWLAWRALLMDGLALGVLDVRDDPAHEPIPNDELWAYLTAIGSPGSPSDEPLPTELHEYRKRVLHSLAWVVPGPLAAELVRLAAGRRPFADLQGD